MCKRSYFYEDEGSHVLQTGHMRSIQRGKLKNNNSRHIIHMRKLLFICEYLESIYERLMYNCHLYYEKDSIGHVFAREKTITKENRYARMKS